jgi:hypothetical protein
MKYFFPLFTLVVLMCAACSQNTRVAQTTTSKADSSASIAQPLFATLSIKDSIKVGDSVVLKFTIYNTADTVQQFCKWHTPFEPLMSKYLDVKGDNGEEANYKGAMAKRIMPPPADSYVKVKPGDSLSINVDVLKGYALTKPGKYSVMYNSQNMSGLVVKDSVNFVYIP